jgi:BirA family transcriptional regulator, biotin operon repressor / biotin---[acetyl-CoA-carboxylase] ligase
VVQAGVQTSGRGRHDKKWQTLAGENLYFSIILKGHGAYSGDLTRYASLKVAETLSSYKVQASIKWPNDVLVNGKKICGILAEASTQVNGLKSLVIGIGLNVNADEDALLDVGRAATSMCAETDRAYMCKDVLEVFLENFKATYAEFLNSGMRSFKHEWEHYAFLIQVGMKIRYSSGEITGQGKVIEIAEDGSLKIQGMRGDIFDLNSGEVEPL